MVDVVTEMHTRSGLTEEVRASTVDLATAETLVLDYIRQHVKQAKTAPLAGNSIATDRGFIARDMPALDAFLHYRMIDVSSIKELCRRWYPRIYFGQPAKGLAHRALADIHESIRELQVLPAHRVRAAAGAHDQRHRRGRRPSSEPPRPTPQGIDSAAERPEQLVSTSPLHRSGGNGGCSSVGRASGCDPECRGFESRHSPHRSEGVFALRPFSFARPWPK